MINRIKSKYTEEFFDVNDEHSLVDMQRGCPTFFKTKHGKRETYTDHRGFLIVRNTKTFSGRKPQRMTAVYMFIGHNFLHVGGDVSSVRSAKRMIDLVIEEKKYE